MPFMSEVVPEEIKRRAKKIAITSYGLDRSFFYL